MKKQYKLLIEDILEDSDDDDDSPEIWLETGEGTILLPPEIAKYLDAYGIMGIT
tara:strand:+ start:434 stop:595 length:162 start_codon:yes stop_codon:yes gene_type:complete